MNAKLILAAPCLALLAACGGSNDGSATNPTTDPTTVPTTTDPVVLQTFGDGAGIARAKITQNGITMVANVMGANIQSYSPDPTGVIDPSGVNFSGSNAYGDFYTGTTTINGTQVNILFYEDSSQEVAGAYLVGNGENAAIVLGNEVSNIPSGSYSYTGTNVIGLRDGSYLEDGTFAMNVNFTSSTASLTGSTASSSIGGSGISVNSSDGTFTSNNLTLTETASGLSTTATIHGNFHGSGATGVTGLYTDNATTPTYAGAIAGTR
tara:strand:+ start:284 stop:1078 length:795 start_codon:yes stop_codon:yes gene_type:complete